MDWFDLGEVPWLGVAVATLAAFTVGFIWYHPRAFGAAWARLADVDLDGLRETRGLRGATSVVVLALTAVVMAALQAELLVTSIVGGLQFGAVVGVVLRFAWGLLHDVPESRPLAVTLLNAVHDVILLAIVGAVIGAFL